MENWKKWDRNISKNPFHTTFSPFTVKQKIISNYGQRIPDDFRPDLKNNTLLRHLLYRSEKSMNTFVAVTGSVRTGKSYFCLKMAELYMKEKGLAFDVDTQVSFTMLPFLKWSMNSQNSCFVFDELQVSMSPREWFNLAHRVFNTFSDIQGLRRNVLFMPFPNMTYIDKHLRGHVNYIVRTIIQGHVKLWKRNIMPEKEEGEKQHWRDPLGTVRFKLPSIETIRKYEALKKVFTDNNLRESIELIEKSGNPTENELINLEFRKLRNVRMKQQIDDNRYTEQIINNTNIVPIKPLKQSKEEININDLLHGKVKVE